MDRPEWARPVSADEMQRRASGRRHVNSIRQLRARLREREVLDIAFRNGLTLRERGVQALIARQLGCHRSTISRAVHAILDRMAAGRPCPACGLLLPPGTRFAGRLDPPDPS